MTKLNLGKIRMRFAGDYNAATGYVPTDIIRDVATGHLYVPILAAVPAGTALTDAASFELFIAAPVAGATAAQGAKADTAIQTDELALEMQRARNFSLWTGA